MVDPTLVMETVNPLFTNYSAISTRPLPMYVYENDLFTFSYRNEGGTRWHLMNVELSFRILSPTPWNTPQTFKQNTAV